MSKRRHDGNGKATTPTEEDILRLPPHDLDAETGVLAALLIEPVPADHPRVLAVMNSLAPEDFYLESNRRIYRAMEALHVGGRPVDPILLAARLAAEGHAAERESLGTLIQSVGSPAGAVGYAEIVRNHARSRDVIDAARKAIEDAYASGSAVDIARGLAAHLNLTIVANAPHANRKEPLTMPELDSTGAEDADWLLRGLLARGAVTIVAGQAKAGKSYFVAALIAALEAGRDFLGIPTSKTRALILSEEPTATLRAKRNRFGWKDSFVRPRAHAYPRRPFAAIVAEAVKDCEANGCGLLVVDTWAHWAGMGPDGEKDAGATQAALAPLHEASTKGLAVLIVHHLRKSQGDGTDEIRGSTALAAGVDVIVTLKKATKDRRSLHAEGRWESSAIDLVMELEGAEYRNLGEPSRAAGDDMARRIVETLQRHPWQSAETLQAALKAKRAPLKATLAEALMAGAITRIGSGSRGDPYLYAPAGTTPPKAAEPSPE